MKEIIERLWAEGCANGVCVSIEGHEGLWLPFVRLGSALRRKGFKYDKLVTAVESLAAFEVIEALPENSGCFYLKPYNAASLPIPKSGMPRDPEVLVKLTDDHEANVAMIFEAMTRCLENPADYTVAQVRSLVNAFVKSQAPLREKAMEAARESDNESGFFPADPRFDELKTLRRVFQERKAALEERDYPPKTIRRPERAPRAKNSEGPADRLVTLTPDHETNSQMIFDQMQKCLENPADYTDRQVYGLCYAYWYSLLPRREAARKEWVEAGNDEADFKFYDEKFGDLKRMQKRYQELRAALPAETGGNSYLVTLTDDHETNVKNIMEAMEKCVAEPMKYTLPQVRSLIGVFIKSQSPVREAAKVRWVAEGHDEADFRYFDERYGQLKEMQKRHRDARVAALPGAIVTDDTQRADLRSFILSQWRRNVEENRAVEIPGREGKWVHLTQVGQALKRHRYVYEKLRPMIESLGSFEIVDMAGHGKPSVYMISPKPGTVSEEEQPRKSLTQERADALKAIFETLLAQNPEQNYVDLAEFLAEAVRQGIVPEDTSRNQFLRGWIQPSGLFGQGAEWTHVCRRFDPRDDMYKFIFFGFDNNTGKNRYYTYLRRLKDMAVPEIWDFYNPSGIGLLDSYMVFTLYRLRLEDKVLVRTDEDGRKWAAFNTGLVDTLYRPICCLLEENSLPGRQPWVFKGFGVHAHDYLGNLLVEKIGEVPEKARYFEPADLLLDTAKPIFVDHEHIIIENVDRLPWKTLGNAAAMLGVELPERRVGQMDAATKAHLGQLIRSNAPLYNTLKRMVDEAVDIAWKRVEWNYKAAIPMYYPRGNTTGLFLPLNLGGTSKPNTALVVAKSGNSYIGKTIYPLRWAYEHSRLVCRTDSDWLRVEDVRRIPEVYQVED